MKNLVKKYFIPVVLGILLLFTVITLANARNTQEDTPNDNALEMMSNRASFYKETAYGHDFVIFQSYTGDIEVIMVK